jgi:hypothetical protein
MNEGSGMNGLGYLLELTRWWKLDLAENTGCDAAHLR